MALAVLFIVIVSSQGASATTGPDALVTYVAALSGPAESPPNASPGTGNATVDIDAALHTMRVRVTFSGLTGNTTAAHIHAPTTVAGTGTVGVATQTPTFSGFPSGVTSGTYDNTFDLTLATSWNPAYVTANGGTEATAEVAFLNSLAAGKAYLNIHSSTFGGGEIRGFLTPAPTVVTLSGLRAEALSLLEWLRGVLHLEQAR